MAAGRSLITEIIDSWKTLRVHTSHRRAHTSREMSAHKSWGERTQVVRWAHTWKLELGGHINFLQRIYLHIFHTCRSKYRRVRVKCCTKENLCAHRLWEIKENIALYSTGIYFWSRDSEHPHHPLSAVDWNPLACSTCVRGPTTGDSFSILCVVVLIEWTYSFIMTFNIMLASAKSASE